MTPDPTQAAPEVLIIGGGAIGLTAAFELVQRGRTVRIIDPSPGRGALWVAAGMLAPASEAHFGEEGLVRLLVAAAREWERFAPALEAASGHRLGYRRTGTLQVAVDAGDRADLARMVALQRSLGLEADDLDRASLHSLEPALAPAIRAGVHTPGDHQVDTRALATALLDVLARSGVIFDTRRVVAIEGARARTDDGSWLAAQVLIVCPGAHASTIAGLEALGLPPVRPVKGHVLRLFGPPLLERTVRANVHGRPVYLVPRAGGELVVGATVEERGFDTSVLAGEVFRLLEDARRIVPGLDELELVEAIAGLRPGSPDNAPSVQWVQEGRVLAAVGHYRNGVLLAPLTASLIGGMIQAEAGPTAALFAAAHR